MSDNLTKEQRKRSMRGNKSKDTKPELKVRKYLFSKGFRYRIHDSRFPGHPDIVLPKYKTAIFVNGCFWHHHSGCKKASIPKTNTEYWNNKLEKNVQRDKKNQQLLQDMGWQVLVVWECEIKSDFNSVMNDLIDKITDSINNL